MTIQCQANDASVCLTVPELKALWTPDGLMLTTEQLELIEDLPKRLGRLKNSPLADYLCGKPAKILDREMMKVLSAIIMERIRPQRRAVAALLVLGKVIDRGNAQGIFQICPPPVPYLLPRPPSPFAAERWPDLDVRDQLIQCLARQVKQSPILNRQTTTSLKIAEIALGEILVSSLVYGGLLDASLLDALVRKIKAQGPTLECVGERGYVELSLHWKRQPNAEFRRWFPDDLSAILILRLSRSAIDLALPDDRATNPDAVRQLVWRSIKAFLRASGVSASAQPTSLGRLISAVLLDIETRIPMMLAHYASRNFISHSLKPSVWKRLHGYPVETRLDQAPSEIERASSQNSVPREPGEVIDGELEPRWLTKFRQESKGSNQTLCSAQVAQLIDGQGEGFGRGSAGELFGSYFLYLLEVQRRPLKTARTRTIALAREIGGLFGALVSETLGAEEWTAIYEDVLGNADTPGERKRLAILLKEFHGFLEKERGVEPVNAQEVFGAAEGLVPVDANIISPREFEEIREKFAAGIADEMHPEIREIAWLILTLAYRCGLRRMEVLKLELADVLIEEPAELLIRPTAARRLKTKSSTRKSPLYALLTNDELARLRQWLERRRVQEHASPFSRFLFAVPSLRYEYLHQETLFQLLHRFMREVTGDPTLRFHHLRHTFASRSCFALITSATDHPERLSLELPGFADDLANCTTLRSRLFGSRRHTRKDIWAVSALLGHSGPDVSMEHYIHILDLCLAEYLSRADIAPARTMVVAAAGRAYKVANQHRDETGFRRWIASLVLRQNEAEAVALPRHSTATRASQKYEVSPYPAIQSLEADEPFNRIWRLLQIVEKRQGAIEDVASRHGLSPSQLTRYVSSARWLASLRMSPQGAFRHRFEEFVPDRRTPNSGRRIACPLKPQEQRDKELIQKYSPLIQGIAHTERALTEEILKYFAVHARDDYAGLLFKSPDTPQMARDFVNWLELIGIKRSSLSFEGFDVTTKRSTISSRWREALGLHSSIKIAKQPPLNGRKDWACPWLGIKPVFPDGRGKDMKGSAAFRFLLVMGAISLGLLVPPEDQMLLADGTGASAV